MESFLMILVGVGTGFFIGYLIGLEDGAKDDNKPKKDIDSYNWGYKDGFNDAEKYRDTIYDKRLNK